MKRSLLVGGAAMAVAAAAIVRGDVLNAASALERVPTFTKDVAPILYRACVSCHRPAEVAPMSLISRRSSAMVEVDHAEGRKPSDAALVCRRAFHYQPSGKPESISRKSASGSARRR